MTTRTLHPLAADYLDRLRRSASRLPRGRREELVSEIEAHLADAVDPSATDAEALDVLDRLGQPEEIVDAEQPRPPAGVDPRGTREWAAIFLLLFGGFAAGVGWLIGLICLWSSRAWTTRDKWIGTIIVPGGLAGSAFVLVVGSSAESCGTGPGGSDQCTSGAGTGGQILAILLLLVFVIGPIATAVYLARRAGRAAPALE